MKKILLAILIFISFNYFAQENSSWDNSIYTWVNPNADFSKERPKIGLALCGGGALGFGHIGVLKIIDSLGIPIDYIAGTSMGSIVGGFYSIGYNANEIEEITKEIDWNLIFEDNPPRKYLPYTEKKFEGRYQINLQLDGFTPVVPSGLVVGQNISILLSRYTHQYEQVNNFSELPIPFNCVAVDLISGNEVVINNGSLSEAMRASMSIPSMYSPVEWGDKLLIDGGVINNFPVDVVKAMGADIVIGLNISTSEKTKEDYESLLEVISRAADLPRYSRLKQNIDLTEILVNQNMDGFSFMDFDPENVQAIINRGYQFGLKSISDLSALKKYLTKFKGKETSRNKELNDINGYKIFAVQIDGNKTLDFNFIYNLLKITPKDVFSTIEIEEKINELYGLGYFEYVKYDVEPVDDNYVRLLFHVKEKSLRELSVGFKYNDFNKLVGIISLRLNSFLFKGLRTEMDLQFSGLTRFETKISYPSRSFDLPIYPLIHIIHNSSPVNIYSNGDKVAQYRDRYWSIGAGIGLPFTRFLVLEAKYNFQFMNITSDISPQSSDVLFPNWKDKLRQLKLNFNLDLLDDVIIPRSGLKINSEVEIASETLGSDVSYSKFDLWSELYLTFQKKHTIKIANAYMKTWRNVPGFKWFVFGGPDEFLGLDYTQGQGSQFGIFRTEYRYEYKKDIFLKAIFNSGYDYNLGTEQSPIFGKPIIGYGVALELHSLFGPIQITMARGDKDKYSPGNKKTKFYFTAGLKF